MHIKHEKSNGNATYKKSLAIIFSAISNFLEAMDTFFFKNVQESFFKKNLGLLIVKNYLPIF